MESATPVTDPTVQEIIDAIIQLIACILAGTC